MLQKPKEQSNVAAVLFGGEGVLTLAASGVYPKTRVWGSKPENVHCSRAIEPLRIELRWGCEKSRKKTAVGSGVSFKYDPFGRRIYKSSSSATSVFAYDLFSLIEETNASGSAVARYTHGLKIDEPLAMLRSGATSYYHADGLGSLTSLSNSAGALAQTYTYDSFGKQTASSGSLTNPFQYTGREFDSETGLYFYRARYYDPSTGRFLSEDPLQHDGGNNFYAYVLNDPLNLTDAFGKQSNSVDSSLTQAIARGDSAEIEEILEDAKDVLSDKAKQAGREAIKKLRTKAQDWIGQKCKGSVNQEFPSELKDKTLEEIRNLSRGKGDLADAAKKAWKLLNDSRFLK